MTVFKGVLTAVFLCCACIAQIAVPDIPPQVVLSQVLDSETEPNSPCQQACATIASRRSNAVFIGQTGAFEFWDTKQAEVIPACRVEPASAKDLSWMLSVIVEKQCQFAIKSGGHDRTPGSSNADGGVTIDLVKLNQIELAADKQSVTIGAGLRWFDVYRALECEGLMVLGGRVSDVGVGGLLLGGGISFFSNERGLACDSVISYELILPNTTIITVDQESQPRLYVALRGAGAANFGIVTSFTLEVFPLPQSVGIWSGTKMFAWDDIHPFLEANYRVATETMDQDPSLGILNMFGCSAKHNLCYGILQAQHARHNSTEDWPDSLKIYDEIEGLRHTTLMRVRSVSNVTDMLAAPPTKRHRTIYGAFTYRPSVELEVQILDIFRQEMESVRDMAGFVPTIIMHPFSTTMLAKMHKNGGNAFQSITSSEKTLIVFNVSWEWREKLDDDRAYAAYFRLMARVEDAAKNLDVWVPYKYINYAEASQDVWQGYGSESLQALRNLQSEVDRAGIFAADGLARGFFKLTRQRPDSIVAPSSRDGAWDKTEL